MSSSRPKSIPLPCAVLALSVAVCIGSVGTAGASPMLAERPTQAQQREAIASLLDALQLAARKLTDQLVGQAAHPGQVTALGALIEHTSAPCSASATTPAVLHLREALLNLPPPSC